MTYNLPEYGQVSDFYFQENERYQPPDLDDHQYSTVQLPEQGDKSEGAADAAVS